MKGKAKIVKHRTVVDGKGDRDISQEPEMQKLKDLFSDMSDEEQERTLTILKRGGDKLGSKTPV